MNLAEAERFVKETLYRIDPDAQLECRCVDGRPFERGEKLSDVARAGGDAGYAMAACAALKLLEEERMVSIPNDMSRVQAVLDAAVKLAGGARYFHFHTDTHADPSVAGGGCGHMREAEKEPKAYGLSPDDMPTLRKSLASLLAGGTKQDVLHGDHNERAVFVIETPRFGMMPNAPDRKSSFIYQKSLDKEKLAAFADILFDDLNLGHVNFISREKFREEIAAASDRQLGATLERLANGLPVFKVKENEKGEPVVVPESRD